MSVHRDFKPRTKVTGQVSLDLDEGGTEEGEIGGRQREIESGKQERSLAALETRLPDVHISGAPRCPASPANCRDPKPDLKLLLWVWTFDADPDLDGLTLGIPSSSLLHIHLESIFI
ncbi:hypothetical protein EUGRSUZ_L01632 [Eucalyptus grandis]|uniref:Uncharacterized protein n=1 Tax=Eucalyptus grandis TaxID=71139 RepID=A0A058ZSM7_EUCGR|nr:hypothetical protein EUGRSUZ_L01632 [Eucalyptus grandis]